MLWSTGKVDDTRIEGQRFNSQVQQNILPKFLMNIVGYPQNLLSQAEAYYFLFIHPPMKLFDLE